MTLLTTRARKRNQPQTGKLCLTGFLIARIKKNKEPPDCIKQLRMMIKENTIKECIIEILLCYLLFKPKDLNR